MHRRKLMTIIILLFVSCVAFAQEHRGQHKRMPIGEIQGYVFDSTFDLPIEYASIILFSHRDSAQVSGTITDLTGFFHLKDLRPGKYFMDVSFIGYAQKRIDDIAIRRGAFQVDLGEITIDQTALKTDDVEFSIERAPVEYHIDKKVINVSKQPTAISGTAVDVLENIPSVTVDIEGNVSLRGSGNFRVLIDGRPSILEPTDALQQIPASSIDNIEIITNPSAKYEPDGTSGIVNIIMKKNILSGSGGLFNINYGLNDKYGGDFLLNHKQGILSLSIGADYNRRIHEGTSYTESYTESQGQSSYYHSNGISSRGRTHYGFRGTADLNLSPSDILSIGSRWGWRSHEREAELDYDEWVWPPTGHIYYTSINEHKRSGDFLSVFMDYNHSFPRKDHEISTRVSLSQREGEEDATTELQDMSNVIAEGRRSFEDGPSDRVSIRLDYTLPLRELEKLELGYQSRIGSSGDNTGLSQYNPASGQYEIQPQYSHSIEYNRDIHSLYSTYSGETGKLGYMGGLRGEYTLRKIELVGENSEYTIDRPDLYPSMHFSYRFTPQYQVMTSYNRRIHRPRSWYLDPFETWTDAYNVRRGNPDLQPEYIDSYELAYQMSFGDFQFSTEAYYRVTDNMVERVRSVYAEGVTLRSIENVGTEYTFGTEFMLEGNIFKWWNLNNMWNIYNNRIEGILLGENLSTESNSWSTRFNNTFKPGKSTRLQINGNYNSDRVFSQGRMDGYFITNVALEQEFLEKSLTFIFQVNDIFKTSKHESISQGTNFHTFSSFEREAPIYMLTIRYNINNYKAERKRERNGNGGEEEDEF
ncbi:MAG: TonB-dependent receptor [Candidatus Electryonea clarkiae]|nr:TonB-dependent receptor [Candidatus Electryonea clarkiae]MDP8285671.1 TonB-dependent receptor [Candidatus Electryonea clarkiae]